MQCGLSSLPGLLFSEYVCCADHDDRADSTVRSSVNSSAVSIAIRNDDAEALEILLQHNATLLEERTLHHCTPLLLACRWGSLSALAYDAISPYGPL